MAKNSNNRDSTGSAGNPTQLPSTLVAVQRVLAERFISSGGRPGGHAPTIRRLVTIIREKYEQAMITELDTYFYVGTVHQHPKSWIIVGLFYPPYPFMGDMFDATT